MPRTKRKDKSRVVLRTGESQRADGTYHFSWTDANHKRRYVYAKTLDELRYKEEQIAKDKSDGIKAEARYTTVNDIYELWKDLKRGLKNNTFENYKYMYETFVRHQIGSKTVSSLRKTDIKRFYNYLADERHLKPATIDNIHTVLHQILDMAVDDDYIRNNPSNNVLKELKQSHCFQTEKRRALTKPEQELFLDYLKNSPTSKYWYPVFAVMIGTGLRVGEVTGLRWCDIDLEEGIIDVNHTLVYYDHRTEGSKRGCYFNVNTTKTPAGRRKVPMLGFVKEAFLMEKERQELLDLHCEATVDGYTDFIFINRFGQPQHQATLNKAIRRIIRDCNDEQLLKDENAEVLLPHFSCHSLRHTFTTRMCEAGVNVKVIQDTLGHKDISTTVNIKNPYEQLNESKQLDFVCIMKRANHKQTCLRLALFNNYLEFCCTILSYSEQRVSSRIGFFNSHSQTVSTFQPCEERFSATRLSRAILVLIFSSQNSVFVFGITKYLQFV